MRGKRLILGVGVGLALLVVCGCGTDGADQESEPPPPTPTVADTDPAPTRGAGSASGPLDGLETQEAEVSRAVLSYFDDPRVDPEDIDCIATTLIEQWGIADVLGSIRDARSGISEVAYLPFDLAVDRAVSSCEAFVPPFRGDYPPFDELADECAAGAMASCDVLVLVSIGWSEYLALGFSCGESGTPRSREGCASYEATTDRHEAWMADYPDEAPLGAFVRD